ncbi:MAG: adenosylcobinamide-GDP ribazoletransferase [Nitrospirales bacterium]
MRSAWAGFALAWQFLTIIPLPSRSIPETLPSTFSIALRWFPIVGFLLGLGLVCIDQMLGQIFAPLVLNLIILSLYVVVTGGLHQDGLADTVDALAGGTTPEQRLEIFRDSHIGALGVTGLVLSLGLRYVSLMALPVGMRELSLLCMPAVGRWSMVMGVWKSVYPRVEGLAASFIRNSSSLDVVIATLVVGVGLGVAFGPIPVVVVLGVGYLLVRGYVWWMTKKVGGITGDILGSINEGMEIVFMLCAPMLVLLG